MTTKKTILKKLRINYSHDGETPEYRVISDDEYEESIGNNFDFIFILF